MQLYLGLMNIHFRWMCLWGKWRYRGWKYTIITQTLGESAYQGGHQMDKNKSTDCSFWMWNSASPISCHLKGKMRHFFRNWVSYEIKTTFFCLCLVFICCDSLSSGFLSSSISLLTSSKGISFFFFLMDRVSWRTIMWIMHNFWS